MSDNPKCPHCKKNAPDSTGMHRSANGGIIRCWNASDEPPAPRISEEEIHRVAHRIAECTLGYPAHPKYDEWRDARTAEISAILRRLNESRKA